MAPSITQLLIVLAIIVLLFGTKKLRSIGSDLGGALKGFRSSMKEDDETSSEPKEITGETIEGEAEKVEPEEEKVASKD